LFSQTDLTLSKFNVFDYYLALLTYKSLCRVEVMLSLFKQSNNQMSSLECSLGCFNSGSKFWPKINLQHTKHLIDRIKPIMKISQLNKLKHDPITIPKTIKSLD